MKHFNTLLTLLALFPTLVFANPGQGLIAEVVKMRGEITQLSPGSKTARKVVMGDKFLEDTSIVTGPKSFIKIKFIDQSELNVGPESKIVITEMKKESAGIISLLKGRIRTEVQKENLKDQKNQNKFFIKTRTAAMGVRGTDFQTIYNPDNKITSLLTYEGEVAMAKVDEKTYEMLENAPEREVVRDELTKGPSVVDIPGKKLDEIEELNKVLKHKSTVLVPPGQNSFSSDSLKKISLPIKISPVQLDALYKNEEFKEKSADQLNLQDAADSLNYKSKLKVAPQVAPVEGLYNEKTGDFAPKAGGYIDLSTALYIAPNPDAELNQKSGVYVPNKIGAIDADTGQYAAPKGLILDAEKGFVLDETQSAKGVTKAPELFAMKEDLNKNIAKDLVVGGPLVDSSVAFNINEKFIRDRILFSIWGMNQKLVVNDQSTTSPYLEIESKRSTRLSFEWQSSTINRFSPMLGVDFSIVKFDDLEARGISQESEKLIGLSYGFQYALSRPVNLYAKLGLQQDHYLEQSSTGSSSTYILKRVVLTRLSLGANGEWFKGRLFSIDASAGAFLSFRKRLNNFVIKEGAGMQLEILPKYALSEKSWLALGIKIENQSQKHLSSLGYINDVKRESGGLEVKYLSDF